MYAGLTAEILQAFLYGCFSLVAGGILFEQGKSFVKTAGSNQFKGKIEALPFFFLVIVLGWAVQHLDSFVTSFVHSIPPLTRAGMMVFGSMLLFNYSVNNFNYTDEKSLPIYLVGVALMAWPFL